MNVHDSQRMRDVLQPLGYSPTDDPARADLILVNTCSVREKSRLKVLSTLGRLGPLKQRRPDLLIGVAGCVAQQDGHGLLSAGDGEVVDLVFSPDHIAQLPRLVLEARERRTVETGFSDVEGYRFLQAQVPDGGAAPTALVTIQKGCDNHCAYCIVPLVRGPEVSRPASEILSEIELLAAAGTREVTLIGQNVNSYRGLRGEPDDFVRLLEAVDAIPGLARIRFTTSHPKDFSEALAEAFGSLKRLCPWLHLPVQSGSSRVLERMNRGYSREHYLALIQRVRQVCPDVSIGTDLIVGFPGEEEDDFQQTLSLLEYIQYDYAYSFMYCPRSGTAAASLDGMPSEGEKNQRLRALQARQDEISLARLSRFEGRDVPVLVEGPSRKGKPQLCGRSPGNHVVNFNEREDGPKAGELVQVHIERAGKHSLSGSLLA